jgi:hypothetical protein
MRLYERVAPRGTLQCESNVMLSPEAEEKRGAPRYPLERLAKIQLGHGIPPRYCLITDVSGGGVRINAFGYTVPDEFVLLLSGDGPAQDGRYEVIWRLGYDVGARLII